MTLTEFLTRFQSEAQAIVADHAALNRNERRNRTANGKRRTTSKRVKAINAASFGVGMAGIMLASRLGDVEEIKALARDGSVKMKRDRLGDNLTAGPRLDYGQSTLFIAGKLSVADVIKILESRN